MALEKRLNTLANNVANLSTAGYRGDGVTFATMLAQNGDTSVAFVSPGSDFISRANGDLTKTDNPLDVAVQGEAWLGIKTPNGVAYTRDGRMRMTATGQLQTLDGYAILDAGNSAISVDPAAGAPTISADGMITQAGQQVAALGLFNIDNTAKLSRFDNSGVYTDKPATAVLDFNSNGIMQGFVEGSNVNPILEMAKLIQISRAFESVSTATTQSESSLGDAIKTLGSTS
jgi:flagellar basal-body rod protein FlgF